jgi:predicted hydrocarbon binding protein
MNGVIFEGLKKFVETRLSSYAWPTLLMEAGIGTKQYLPMESYPDEEMIGIVTAAARTTDKPVATILEDFGEFIAPDLMKLYGGISAPGWRTLDLLEHVEKTVHRVVRARNPDAAPPVIRSARTTTNEVTVRYESRRRMCAMARGLVHGVARYFGEEVEIAEPACMLKGHSACTLLVRLVPR